MKEYNVVATIVLILALSLVLTLSIGAGLTIFNKNAGSNGVPEAQLPEAASLHYKVEDAVDQKTIEADIMKLLNISADVDYTIIGEADTATPGKYEFVCAWKGDNLRTVDVCVYDNTFSYSVGKNPIEDNSVAIYYEDALATDNFTKGITVKDSLGNKIQAVKRDDSMSFENAVGTYTVHYIAKDAAGHEFSFTLDYVVTYPFSFNIENPNVEVRASDKTVTIPVDFDNAPLDQINLWLEDANGKKIAGIYSTITQEENEDGTKGGYIIILRAHYYKNFVGQTIELSVCSDYGKATFYVTVLDE